LRDGILKGKAALGMRKRVFRSAAKLIEQHGGLDEILLEIIEELRRDAVSIGDGHRANLRENLIGVGRLVH
jgi:hypothetical protein